VTRRLHPETLAVHLGLESDAATGAVTPPIHLSTTFERDADGAYARGFVYAREGNPTRAALERALALLQAASEAAAFASGSAAAAAVFRALPVGSHVVVPRDMYHGIRVLLRQGWRRRGCASARSIKGTWERSRPLWRTTPG
jgi:cystathionine gamma-synthase